MRKGVYGTSFIYEEKRLQDVDSEIIHVCLKNLESKHVGNIRSELSEQICSLSKKYGYENVVLGSHRTEDIKSELEIIRKMYEDENFKRPVRIVIDQFNRFWTDNTHTTISYYLLSECQFVGEIPFYIVDFTDQQAKIISIDESIKGKIQDLRNIYSSAKRIVERVDLGVRPEKLSWNVGHLCEDLNLSMHKQVNVLDDFCPD